MTETNTEIVKPGYKTTEFYVQLMPYVLAGIVLYLGYSPEQVTDTFEQIENQANNLKNSFADMVAVIAPVLGSMFYTKKRSDVKTQAMK